MLFWLPKGDRRQENASHSARRGKDAGIAEISVARVDRLCAAGKYAEAILIKESGKTGGSDMKTKLCRYALRKVSKEFRVTENDIGPDQHLSRYGMNFATHSYEIEDIGHLCVMTMKAFWGLMTMETVVISPVERDLPLFNIDRVSAFGKDTLLIEIYDTQIEPLDADIQATFSDLLERDSAVSDVENKPHWYDEIRYPFSYGKAGNEKCADMRSGSETGEEPGVRGEAG